MAKDVSFTFNGNKMAMTIEDHWTLLHLIREELGYNGTKEGCGGGECGACTVLVNGAAVNACLYLAAEIDGKDLVTIEGLAANDGSLHPVQAAFVEKGGIQCGFCTPGMIMSAKALLDENPNVNYYSYLWSEVLDADAFEAFKESGDVFNKDLATKYRKYVLSAGGTENSMELYKKFLGKEPSIEPLLKRRGLKW